jgi:hypothetical protein
MSRAKEARVLLEEQLRWCEAEIARLRVENEHLRRSSQAFGDLAERLNIALRTATRSPQSKRPPTAA